MDILIEVIVPIVTAILGFSSVCYYEQNKVKQKVKGNNHGNIVGRDIKNANNKK